MVIVMPALLTLILLIAQFALWAHATHIAQTAAAQALAAARVRGGAEADGQAEANQVLDQLGRGPLTHAHVSVRRDAYTASVRISGTATSVAPFLHLPVHAEATGPVERFRAHLGGSS
jgi:hypothetical protein